MARIAVLGVKLSGVRSGAHLTHLEIAEQLARRGHEVRYAALEGKARTRFGKRVEVGGKRLRKAVDRCDTVLIRDEPRVAELLPHVERKRLVYTCHSPAGDPRELGVKLTPRAIVVWVSDALRRHCEQKHGTLRRSRIIEGCPIVPDRVKAEPGNRVTLVNLSERKGGSLFWDLVDRMPDVEFLGVTGWGEQVIPDRIPPNARVMRRVDDPRKFYRQTKVILLPSADPGTVPAASLPAWGEAWNRVGIEAAMSGIPAIAHPAEGIRASLGDAGVYLDRNDRDAWVSEIRRMMEPEYWRERSEVAREHAAKVEAMIPGIVDRYERLVT